MTIQEFLLARLQEDQAEADRGVRPMGAARAYTPPGHFDEKRTVIERHRDRTMTVTTLGGTETITRCGVCPPYALRPCAALRILAKDYADHPDYDPGWAIDPEPPVDYQLRDSQSITIVLPDW